MSKTSIIHGGWMIQDWANSHEGSIDAGALYQESGRIVAIGSLEDLQRQCPAAPVIGGADYIVAPGFINAHSHGRGLTTFQMGQPDESLETRLVELLGRPEWGATTGTSSPTRGYDPYLDTLYSCVKQMASGITTTYHSHPYFNASITEYAKLTRRVCDAYRDSGIRCTFSLGIRDCSSLPFAGDAGFTATLTPSERSSPELRPTDYIDFDSYVELLFSLIAEYPEIQFQLGPWNPAFCSDELIFQLADMSAKKDLRIQTHLAETRYQARVAQDRYGQSWVQMLAAIGMITERFSGAHCVWLEEGDIATMAEVGAQVVYNPASNLRLQSGIARVRDMLDAQIPVAFGIDSLGMSDEEDMFQDLRLGQLIQNTYGPNGRSIPANTMLDMATRAGAQVTGIEGIGSLEVGGYADMILLSRTRIEGIQSRHSLPEVVLRRAKPRHIQFVVIGGRLLIQDGRWEGQDPAAILADLVRVSSTEVSELPNSVALLKESVRRYLN